MNLHIAPENVFTDTFLNNLEEAGVLANNRVVLRTSEKTLKRVKRAVPFAPLYSKEFNKHTGDTATYDKVFIHQFTPLLYRWAALREFRQLNWAVWGADLYNLPFNQKNLYESLTLARFVSKSFSWNEFLYRAKVSLLHDPYRDAAYRKVSNILTWMTTEYEFASRNLRTLNADHQFFFYENQLPYRDLDKISRSIRSSKRVPTYILGNSSTPELNHVDVVAWMQEHGVKANLQIPVSYGDTRYTSFLKKNVSFYTGGTLEFVDRYMNIQDYLQFLNSADGLIMNNIRPQGYGNIFMMMYLGKPVFLNPKNISAPELNKRGLQWFPLEKLAGDPRHGMLDNKDAIMTLLSHDNLLSAYRDLFSNTSGA